MGRVGAATDTIVQKCFYARDAKDKQGLLIDVLMAQVSGHIYNIVRGHREAPASH